MQSEKTLRDMFTVSVKGQIGKVLTRAVNMVNMISLHRVRICPTDGHTQNASTAPDCWQLAPIEFEFRVYYIACTIIMIQNLLISNIFSTLRGIPLKTTLSFCQM